MVWVGGWVVAFGVQLFILVNAMKIASARRVVAVVPFFPYSKQSKQKKRGTITSKLMSEMLKVVGESTSQRFCISSYLETALLLFVSLS